MFTIYSADVTGNPGNCSYPHKHIILDEDSLKAAVCHDYVCTEYKNSYRNGDNFIGSDCLPVDCDNDHSENPEDWITPEDVLQAFPGVTFAVHYSRFNNRVKNGKPARPKFHVLFPIDYVTDAAFYSNMKKLVNSIFPYAMSVARWIQCEEAITDYGFLAKHPTTGNAMQSPYVAMSQNFMSQTNRLWMEIYQIVKENCATEYKGETPMDDAMERLLRARKGN